MKKHLVFISLSLLALSLNCFSREPDKQKHREKDPKYILGVEPGSDFLQIPDCESDEAHEKICRHGNGEPKAINTIELRPDRPKFTRSNLVVEVKDGKIESYFVYTKGLESQESAYKELLSLLGEPREKSISHKTNIFGANIQSIEASWVTKRGYLVMFEGVSDKIDSGTISVSR